MRFSSRFIGSASSEPGQRPCKHAPSGTRRSGSRLFRSILTLFLIVGTHNALNASTGNSGTPDYLHWLLKNEEGSGAAMHPAVEPATTREEPNASQVPPPASPIQLASIAPLNNIAAEPARPTSRVRVVIERIRRDDTYEDLMRRQNIPKKFVKAFAQKAKPHFDLYQRLRIDTPVKLTFNQKNQIIGLSYPVTQEKTLRVTMDERQIITAALEKNRPATNSAPEKKSPNPVEESASDDQHDDNQLDDDSLVDDMLDDDEDQVPVARSQASEVASNTPATLEVTIRPGDTLASLLARRHVPHVTSLKISKVAKPVFDLARQLSPGKTITLSFAPDGALMAVMYPLDHERTFWITSRDGKQFTAKFEKKQLDIHLESISGTVRNERSLFTASKQAGLSKNQAIKLSGLFEWDIDFAHDLQPGDQFTILQEGLFSNGKRVRDGDIVAAEFTHRGQLFRAVRYIDPNGNVGYYDKDGNNLRKMFIRAPMDFTRISSFFSNNRLHPLLGYTRAHKGVDYAAPMGTPVRAAGDGVIDFVGYQSGFGNLITLRHNGKFSTAYAHLSTFASGLRPGSRVRQGEMIGRVGATGTATGPHLHYEVRVNDQQVNPLSIQSPSRGPVDKKFQADFRNQSNQLLALLKKRKTGDVTHLAAVLMPQVRSRN